MDKLKRILQMFIGVTIASLGMAMVLNCDLGCFVETASYKGISNFTGLPLFLVNIGFEIIIISIATYYGEGLGWTTLVNASYGAIMINLFHNILPHNIIFSLGIFLIPLGWSTLEKSRFGATGSNILMKSLMKKSGKSLFKVRMFIECVFLIIACIFASEYIGWFTLALTFGMPLLLKYMYKLIDHKPAKIKHEFIIGKKN